jgi:hypothetical protein
MILTVTELRQHVASGLPDDALKRLLEAAENDITAKFGTAGSVTEYADGGHELLVLARPVGTVTTVQELADTSDPLTLSTNDYRIEGFMLRRLETGTNPRSAWFGRVKVIHTPPDTEVDRVRLQVALVKLDLAYSGYASEATQDESRTPMPDYQLARRRLLETYSSDSLMVR